MFFVQVKGLNGIYLANIIDSENNSCGSTVITFNNGGAWQRLVPPTGNSISCSMVSHYQLCQHHHFLLPLPPPTFQQPNCSLHLRMDSDIVNGYQSVLSQDSAIGLVMALGKPSGCVFTSLIFLLIINK